MLIYTAEPSPQFHEKLVIWKRDGVLRALDLRGWEDRNASTLKLIGHADAAYGPGDFEPAMVHTGDRPVNDRDPAWRSLAYSTADGYYDIAVPDFLFDGWPQVGLGDYEELRRTLATVGSEPAEEQRLGWVGNCNTHKESRWGLHALAQEHSDLLDVRHVEWVPNPGARELQSTAGNQLSLPDQIRRWGLLIDVEGQGWSARVKLLLHSGRPVFLQERPWREWYWDDLRPMQHYIPVRGDLSDVLDRVRWALDNPDEAARIGRAGQAFAREELKRSDAVRRWGEILHRLAEEPQLDYAPPDQRAIVDPFVDQLTTAPPPE